MTAVADASSDYEEATRFPGYPSVEAAQPARRRDRGSWSGRPDTTSLALGVTLGVTLGLAITGLAALRGRRRAR